MSFRELSSSVLKHVRPIALATALLCPAIAQAGDAAKAKRDLTMVQMNVESQRWEDAADRLKQAVAAMDGLSDAEKAPLLTRISEIKAGASKVIEEDITKRLNRAATADAALKDHDLQLAAKQLDSAEAQAFLDAGAGEKLRARLASLRGGGAAAVTPPPVSTPPKVMPPVVSSEEHDSALSRAKRNLGYARMTLERSSDGVDDLLKKVEADLPALTEAERSPIAADVTAMRRQLAGGKPMTASNTPPTVTTPSASTGQPAGPRAASDQDRADIIARAKRELNFARMSLERSPDGVEDRLKKVDESLKLLTEPERAPLARELATIRQQMSGGANAEQSQRIERGIKQDLDFADQYVGTREILGLRERLAGAREKLDAPDAKKYLDPAASKRLEGRFAELSRRGPEAYKQEVFKEALPYLKKLEDMVAGNPFKGSRYVYPIILEISRQAEVVREDLQYIPEEDADRKAIEARVVAVERAAVTAREQSAKELADADAAAIAAANAAEKQRLLNAAAQAKTEAIAKAASDWKSSLEYVKGWEDEKPAVDPKKVNEDPLPKARSAVRTLGTWFGSTSSVRERYKDDASLIALVATADKTLDTVYAKLNAAYNQSLDQVEKMPVPKVWAEQHVPGNIASRVDSELAGSKYHDATLARAKGLQEKWDAEVKRLQTEHDELVARLSAEAAAKWPAIESSTPALADFNPADAGALTGKIIILKGVYNRSGWDFAGSEWDFTVKVKGVPVAGDYDPNVLKAFREGQDRVSDNIDEHKPWDLIGVVEGKGQCTERVVDEVRIGDSVDRVKIERNIKEDCLKIRIIALRAGPVAVGPK